KVVVAVKDLRGAVALYRRGFGLPQPREQKDAHLGVMLAWFPDTPVILAAPLNSKSWLAQRLEKFGEAPCAILLRDTGHPRSGGTWLLMAASGASVVKTPLITRILSLFAAILCVAPVITGAKFARLSKPSAAPIRRKPFASVIVLPLVISTVYVTR